MKNSKIRRMKYSQSGWNYYRDIDRYKLRNYEVIEHTDDKCHLRLPRFRSTFWLFRFINKRFPADEVVLYIENNSPFVRLL